MDVDSTGLAALSECEPGADMAAGRSAAEADEAQGTDATAAEESADLTNKSVIKATVLLSELGRHRQGITVTELAQAVGMTRPTAFRLLLSLEQTGFVDRVDNRYLLGWQVARLGRLADPYTGAVARRALVRRRRGNFVRSRHCIRSAEADRCLGPRHARRVRSGPRRTLSDDAGPRDGGARHCRGPVR